MSEEVAAKQLAASFLEHLQVPLANVEWLEQPPKSFLLAIFPINLSFSRGEKVAGLFRSGCTGAGQGCLMVFEKLMKLMLEDSF